MQARTAQLKKGFIEIIFLSHSSLPPKPFEGKPNSFLRNCQDDVFALWLGTAHTLAHLCKKPSSCIYRSASLPFLQVRGRHAPLDSNRWPYAPDQLPSSREPSHICRPEGHRRNGIRAHNANHDSTTLHFDHSILTIRSTVMPIQCFRAI